MLKQLITTILAVALGAGGALYYMKYQNHDAHEFCAKHQLEEKDCSWCDHTLVEKLGMCPEHKVPEAFCSRCNSKLIAGFKAENDWCAGHDLPESQCERCKAGDLPPGELPK